MPEIVDLILADHRRIRKLLGDLDDAAGAVDEPGIDRLGMAWRALAALLEVHLDAAEQIAYPALYGSAVDGSSGPVAQFVTDDDNIREALDEARFHLVGSPLWWLAVRVAGRAAIRHIDTIESARLPRFRWERSPREREILGRRWLAFVTARAGDGDADG